MYTYKYTYAYIHIHTHIHAASNDYREKRSFVDILKRALYKLKRALHTLKRDLYTFTSKKILYQMTK